MESSVLIIGSLPPEARDLDLLVKAEELAEIENVLTRAGFEPRNGEGEWSGVAGGKFENQLIELIPAESLGLAPAQLTKLLETAKPLDGLRHLLRPAPHSTLLLLAHQLGPVLHLSDRRRRRVREAIAENPQAWSDAAAELHGWKIHRSLGWLRQAYERGDDGGHLSRFLAARERLIGANLLSVRGWLRASQAMLRQSRLPLPIVALSGLDGAGKSTQARILADNLRSAGLEPVILWDRIIYNRSLLWITAPLRSLLRILPHLRHRFTSQVSAASQTSGVSLDEIPDQYLAVRGVRQAFPWLTSSWVTLVAVLHVLPLRWRTLRETARGRIVIRDRYVLDSLVHLQDRYGTGQVSFQMSIIRRLTPPPLVNFLLDVPAHEAYQRKPEEYPLEALAAHRILYLNEAGSVEAQVLDGDLPAEVLGQLIAAEVRRRLQISPE